MWYHVLINIVTASLNPGLKFPIAHLSSTVAQYGLQRLEKATKSLLEAQKLCSQFDKKVTCSTLPLHVEDGLSIAL